MEKSNKLFILCGEAFAGKSTLSKKISEQFNAKIVGRDEIYFATDNILALENTPDEDDDTLWKNMWLLVIQGVKNQLKLGNSVVVDDNCIYFKERELLRSVANDIGVESVLIYLDVSTETIKERKAKNKITKHRHDVPSEWLIEDSGLFERPAKEENHITYSETMNYDELVKILKS